MYMYTVCGYGWINHLGNNNKAISKCLFMNTFDNFYTEHRPAGRKLLVAYIGTGTNNCSTLKYISKVRINNIL